MPRGDRTGPAGMGPMTGRGAGYCAGYDAPGFMNPAWGRGGGGRGWGGGGWGRRNWGGGAGVPGRQRFAMGRGRYAASSFPVGFGPRITKEQELEALKDQVKFYEQALGDIQKRISEIESSPEG